MAKSSRKKPVGGGTPSTPVKASAAKAPVARAESWLSAAERKLLDGTVGRSLAEASQKQLQATIVKARRLRDKWRDLFARQMKASKRTDKRGEQANSRSLDKSELFAAAVRRVEARLGELVDGVTAAVTARKPAARAPKRIRSAGHRSARASVRKSLAKLSRATTARPPAQATPPAKAAATATRAEEAATPSGKGSPKPTASKPVTSKKARQAGKRKVLAAAGGVVGYDRTKQRSAKASATAARIKFDGLSTRRRGHTLVAGKRKQGRRDGR